MSSSIHRSNKRSRLVPLAMLAPTSPTARAVATLVAAVLGTLLLLAWAPAHAVVEPVEGRLAAAR